MMNICAETDEVAVKVSQGNYGYLEFLRDKNLHYQGVLSDMGGQKRSCPRVES